MLLGERLLVDLRVVRRAQLGQALQAQHLHGGRLGTNLVQLGFMSMDELATVLGAHLAVPVAMDNQFEDTRAEVLARLPVEVAARVFAVPLHQERSGTLVVAMMDPRDPVAVAAVEHAVGSRVQACVAPELRVRYWLEKHYGIPRPNFFLRADSGIGGGRGSERRRTVSASPMFPATESKARLGRIQTVKRPAPAAGAGGDDFELDITVDARRRSPAANRALERISVAMGSNDILDALVEYLAASVGCGLVLMVRDQVALGWRGAPPLDPQVVSQIAVPLDLPSCFRSACENATTFRGAAPAASREWHHRLSEMLGQITPRDLVVVPIRGGERVLALIYAHMANDGDMSAQAVSDLEALAEAVTARVARAVPTAAAAEPTK